MAAVHYRRTSRATFIQDVLVEIASVFAPSRYKFIRSLSATERSIRRSINVASSSGNRDDSNRLLVRLSPLLHFLLSPTSLLSLISSTPTNRNRCSHTRTVSLHNTARDNKFWGWRNRYRFYSSGMNNREGDRKRVIERGKFVEAFVIVDNLKKNLRKLALNHLVAWRMSNGKERDCFR